MLSRIRAQSGRSQYRPTFSASGIRWTCVVVLLCPLNGTDNARTACAAELEIVVPAYFYPSGGGDWSKLNAAAAQVPLTAIMNPSSGPGNAKDSNYVSAVNALRAAGGRVIGYVHTTYTARPLQQVLDDIDRYKNWYNIDGIFVDEMSNTGPAERLNYYRDIYNHVKSINPDWEVMGNPGTTTIAAYLTWPAADRLMVFENVGANYPTYTPSAWNFNYDSSRFVHLVHTEPSSANVPGHLNLAVQRNAGGIYITDDALPNPWNRLPTYWSQHVATVAAINADYNGDGTVDAADYVDWRKNDGSTAGYDRWRANFGTTIGTSAASDYLLTTAAVPEPASLGLIGLLVALLVSWARRPASSRRPRICGSPEVRSATP